jgi:DNA-binding CsgD family transcriptional regulator
MRKFARRLYRPPLPIRSELTPREKTVVRMIAEGYTSRQIADILGRSIKTIECHRTNVMHKTGTTCIAQLVRYAMRVGLVT